MYVTKADGTKQKFLKKKIIRTCIRMGAPEDIARKIADKIEERAYDGIPTKEILNLIFHYLGEYDTRFIHRRNLRKSLSLLRPKPDFERFVRLIFKELGYDVLPNQIVKGKCVEYEIDGILIRNGRKFLLEVKHHLNPHTYTGMDVCLVTFAKYLDINEGFEVKTNNLKLDGIFVVCNTKFSNHAIRYAICKGINLLGWNIPLDNSLEKVIEKKKLYPITILKDEENGFYNRLADAGILLIKQIEELPLKDLHEATGLDFNVLERLKSKAKLILKQN